MSFSTGFALALEVKSRIGSSLGNVLHRTPSNRTSIKTNTDRASVIAELLVSHPIGLGSCARRTSLLASLGLVLLFLGVCNSTVLAQTGEWAWQSGPSTISPPYHPPKSGVYGTLGVAAATNMPGGRYGAAMWFDKSGNLWLFGGYGVDSASSVGVLNDLWDFSPATGEWTWMGGSDTEGGASGVFGTQGTPSTSNIPPSRSNPVTWTDSNGNLWLFGGTQGQGADPYGNTSDDLDDVWEFTPSTLAWTWMGSNPLFCGTCGIAFADSGLRSDGTFWLLGGSISGASSGNGVINELAKFSPSTDAWNLLTGTTNSDNAVGIYGTMATPAPANTPGGRDGAAAWTDSNGNAWLFGGLANG